MAEQQNEEPQQEPRVHVDEEWKKAVQEEKARLREQDQATRRPGTGPAARGQPLPEPSIPIFLAGLYTQTLVALGEMENPATGKRERRLDEAQYLIDTISLLRGKMEGNLDADEQAYVQNLLTDLRMRYVSAQGAGEAATESEEPEPDQ